MGQARDRVVDAALRMFAENGFSAVSMRDLAGALDIQAPSLYSHFESKDALLAAVVGPFLEAVRTQLDRVPVEPVSHDARHEWLTQAVQLLAANPWQLQMVIADRSLAQHPMFGPELQQIRQQMIRCIVRFGVADPKWAIGVTGAMVYMILPRPGPADVETTVKMTEAFLDARAPAGAS
jgi:AcrR family transcriptional regulator